MSTHDIGSPLKKNATRLLLLGSGELGKEVAIEAQRLGVEVIAVDRYADAPAMQIAHRHHVIDMLDGDLLADLVHREQPHFIVPEVEAIATDRLLELEAEGYNVIPTARATRLTMDREGIRRLAAEDLGVRTSPYRFAGSEAECNEAIRSIGCPCIVKPVMSSSGKGQVVVRDAEDAADAWERSVAGGRAGKARVIVEGFVEFDYEITLLTVRHVNGTSFCEPIGHVQVDGDYRESWQPQPMSEAARAASEHIARSVTEALGGRGIFGVELFIAGEEVLFSEVSPRPHDTGMVTLISQDLSQFALHVRAILGAPIADIDQYGPAASCAILGYGDGDQLSYSGIQEALAEARSGLRIFGKPEIHGKRRLGVALGRADTIERARDKARRIADQIGISVV